MPYIIKYRLFDGHAGYEEHKVSDLVEVRLWFDKYLTDNFWARNKDQQLTKISIEVRESE